MSPSCHPATGTVLCLPGVRAEPVASGPALGWRNPNQTQKNCKLCQIEEGVYKGLCTRRGPEVGGLVAGEGSPEPGTSRRHRAILCRPQLMSEHVRYCDLQTCCCRISITSVVNVFDFRIFGSEGAPRSVQDAAGRSPGLRGTPGPWAQCRSCYGGSYIVSVWDFCVCVGVTLVHGAGAAGR